MCLCDLITQKYKQYKQQKQPFTTMQGVLFAPSDAAFVKLLTALGFPDASFLTRDFVDAVSIKGFAAAAILLA
jgi:hypothetical protein